MCVPAEIGHRERRRSGNRGTAETVEGSISSSDNRQLASDLSTKSRGGC
jgi:hypothetical protein